MLSKVAEVVEAVVLVVPADKLAQENWCKVRRKQPADWEVKAGKLAEQLEEWVG